jgi:tetratricopeptide (TPR) repeat protein
MKSALSRLLMLLCLLLAAEGYAFALDKESKEVWTRVRSKNFLLVGNAGEKEMRRIGARLEQFREALTRLFAGTTIQSTVPTTVIVFRSDESYRPFKPLYDGVPANVAGYFQSSTDLNYITITMDGNVAGPVGTIFHEYVHLFVESNLRGLPLCLNEGLAEYFSTLELTDGGRRATVGKVNKRHLKLLRTEQWLPLKTLLAADNKAAVYNEPQTRDLFYAQSWALAHYLVLGREAAGGRQSDFYRFVGLMAEGLPPEESFKQTFRQDVASLESELKEYVNREKHPAEVTLFDRRTEIKAEALTSALVSDAEVRYYLGDLLLHTNRLEEAAALLNEAVQLDPRMAMAYASLGMVRIRQRNFAEAVPLLRRAVELAPENYLAHYYYAYGLSRQGMDENLIVTGYEAESAKVMRAELMRAIELQPAHPESYHLLAFVNLATGEELEQAEVLLRQAMRMAPAREEFAFVLAQIYERQRAWAKAREVIEPLRRSLNPQLRIRAEQVLKNINTTESELARLRASGLLPENSSASSSASALSQKPRLQKRFAGERVRGLLTNVECDATGNTILTIRDGERTLRFQSENLRRITFVSYVSGMGRSITCGQRNPANLVLLTYRPQGNLQFDGEAVGIEFVPEDLEYEP